MALGITFLTMHELPYVVPMTAAALQMAQRCCAYTKCPPGQNGQTGKAWRVLTGPGRPAQAARPFGRRRPSFPFSIRPFTTRRCEYGQSNLVSDQLLAQYKVSHDLSHTARIVLATFEAIRASSETSGRQDWSAKVSDSIQFQDCLGTQTKGI